MVYTDREKALLKEISDRMITDPIETEKAVLRPFRESDRADYIAYASQSEVQRLCGIYFESEREINENFDRILSMPVPITFAVEYKPNGRVAGNFSIGYYPFLIGDEQFEGKRGVSLSFLLGGEYQRRGIMSGVLEAAIDLYLGRMGLDFVNAGYFEFNEGSRRLQEKCGMKHWMRHTFEFQGQEINTCEMVLWREDYLCARSKQQG